MIVKTTDAQKREVNGLRFDLLAAGEKSMLIRVSNEAGHRVPLHSHPHEQIGYVISGRVQLTLNESTDTLGAGDSYCIPGGVQHSLVALADSQVLDFFSPPRADYL